MMDVKFVFEQLPDLAIRIAKMATENVASTAKRIRQKAIDSMPFAKGPSKPGDPPHAHRGRLRRSILFAVDGDTAYVGPSYSAMQSGGLPPWVGSMHERGGTFTGRKGRTATYPARPFMGPALEADEGEFVGRFVGSL